MNEKVFDSFPILETKRLIIRPMIEEDATQVFKFNSSLEMLKYVPRDQFKEIEEGIKKTESFINGFEEKNALWWTFTLKEAKNNQLIGYGGLFDINIEGSKAEIGYGLLQEFWGQGIISEAIKKIVDFGINKMELHRIYGYIDPQNIPSIKVIEKFNFKKEGILKDDAFARNKYFDMSIYALINKQK